MIIDHIKCVENIDHRAPYAWRYDEVPGELKACDNCGIVKFYPDEE